jgi:nanoRNase/pAp phosphatase (c-di-AMP/oligoRNAs hydrolase)
MSGNNQSILSQIKDADLSNVAIFSGAGVDPDGLASAETMRQLVEMWGGKATAFYRGSFNRPQNKTMRMVMSLALKSSEDFSEEDSYTCIISVDGPSGVCPVQPNFIIDHHEQGDPATDGNDVRMIGSCSAIMWKYAMEAEYDFQTEDGARLAAALAIGLITDTDTGGAAASASLDFEALGFCLTHKDDKIYQEIQNYQVPAYYSDYENLGWAGRTENGPVIVANLGDLPTGRSGVISHCADKYYRTEGNTTTIVFAIVDGCIHASSRTTRDADELMRSVFGAGGGKKGAGGAIVELPALLKDLPDEVRQQVADAIGAAIIQKALQITSDGARSEPKSKSKDA